MEFQDKPYYISRILVLSRRVDYRHYSYGGHIADVIVDDELEVFDVDEGEVPGVEISVRMWVPVIVFQRLCHFISLIERHNLAKTVQ